jgi:3-dehydroshikimate dehydratase
MFKTGLVSISFRECTPEKIIEQVAECGLDSIEWGGDVHVPVGDLNQANKVKEMMEQSGLITSAYGSYYRVGLSHDFEQVLETALALNTKLIRVWAGKKPSSAFSEEDWIKIVDESIQIADLADKKGMNIGFEYHANTLTDSHATALELIKRINRKNVFLYWQPPVGMEKEACLTGLLNIMDVLCNVHVFQWNIRDRRPLEEGRDLWETYISHVKDTGVDRYFSLEFIKDNDLEQLKKDSKLLKELIDFKNKI